MRRGGAAPDGPGEGGGGGISDRAGFVRFRHWRGYDEAGVAGNQAVVRRYGERPTVGFADEPLAR